MPDRKIIKDAVANVLKSWREDGKLYATPPSSKDQEVAEQILYMVESMLKDKLVKVRKVEDV